jgi:hypothetical protein
MTRPTYCHASAAALSALAAFIFSASAAAQDAPAPSTPGPSTPGPSTPPPSSPDTGAAPTEASAAPPTGAPTPIVGPVEHLGPQAYPNDPVRGIQGGSLWATFHGLQWPYMPHTGVGVGGYVWMDTGYESIVRGGNLPNNANVNYDLQQGRFLLRVTPTWSDGKWFVQGQAELVADRNQTQSQPLVATADDIWVKFGRWKTFDVQVGRYEAWEIYHFGMGLDLYTLERQGAQDYYRNQVGQGPVPIYGVTNLFYRQGGVGQGALHVYPTQWLRFEVGTVFGNNPSSGGDNEVGVRPVAVADFGWMKLKAGAEWSESTPFDTSIKGEVYNYGFGGALQFVLRPYLEFGGNYAYGGQITYAQDGTRNDAASFTEYSAGGFANLRIVDGLLFGAGVNYTFQVDQFFDPSIGRYGDFRQWQAFGAIQYHLFKQLYLKFVGGYALATLNPNTHEAYAPHQDYMLSGRLRLQYLF